MRMAAADRVSAVVFCALGVATLVGGYSMDRLEFRQIHPLSIPGLLPMLLGAALTLCAIILWFQANAATEEGRQEIMRGGSLVRLGLTVALACFYALVLVGWLPFMWATALFIATFTTVFSWPGAGDRGGWIRLVAKAAVFGVVCGYAVTLLFEEAFLVRLP